MALEIVVKYILHFIAGWSAGHFLFVLAEGRWPKWLILRMPHVMFHQINVSLLMENKLEKKPEWRDPCPFLIRKDRHGFYIRKGLMKLYLRENGMLRSKGDPDRDWSIFRWSAPEVKYLPNHPYWQIVDEHEMKVMTGKIRGQ